MEKHRAVAFYQEVNYPMFASNTEWSAKIIAGNLIEARLAEGGMVLFHVPSRSMVPKLRPGDYVLVAAQPVQAISIGSLLVLRRGNTWIVHRLLRRIESSDGWRLITKGDRCQTTDPVWESVTTIGVVQAVVRDGRRIKLSTPWRQQEGLLLAVLSNTEARLSTSLLEHPSSLFIHGLRRINRLAFDWFASAFAGDGHGS